MTRIQEIKDMIREEAASPVDRKALESLAGALEETLSQEVPYRPEFKAQLRRKLMAEARRTLTPWYRRPAVWGTSLSVAAAAAVLAIGLQMFDPTAPQGPEQGAPEVTSTPAPTDITSRSVPVNPVLTSAERLSLPVLNLEDERLPAGHPGPGSLAGLDPARGLQVYQLTGLSGRVDERLLTEVAGRLGLTNPPQRTAQGLQVTEGDRALLLMPDGKMIYTDPTAANPSGTPTAGAEGAQALARRFLDRAALPVPDLSPTVTGTSVFTVVYTPRVDGMPVVNGRTVIRVTDRSGVARAEAFAPSGLESKGTQPAVALEQGQRLAKDRGGLVTITGADLVWVRTPAQNGVYLQPYWRVFATNTQGERIARFVPALAQ